MHVARAFNVGDADLHTQFLAPLRGGEPFRFQDREWEPRKTRLLVFEAPELRPDQIAMGRGWGTVEKLGKEVTAEVVSGRQAVASPARPAAVDPLKQQLIDQVSAGALPLCDVVVMAAALAPGRRASEQLAAAEMAVWELLHQGQAGLQSGEATVTQDRWQQLLLDTRAWWPDPHSPLLTQPSALV